MDSQVKKRLKDITLYPCLGTVDGDPTWGEPITIRGYAMPKVAVIVDTKGKEIKISTSVLVEGTDAEKIHTEDELDIPFTGRSSVKKLQPYESLGSGYELIEVLL
jgi:hypothetical protein